MVSRLRMIDAGRRRKEMVMGMQDSVSAFATYA